MAIAKHILVADDDPNDVVILRRTLTEVWVHNPLIVVRNGAEAIDYLAGRGAYADRQEHPLPSLMLLDLKMPKMDGFDVLEWWRVNGNPGEIPIIVLSGSALAQDMARAKELGAAAYRVKLADPQSLFKFAQEVRDYWLTFKPELLRPGLHDTNFFYPR